MERADLKLLILELIKRREEELVRVGTDTIALKLGRSPAEVRHALEQMERDGWVEHIRALSAEDPQTASWYWRLTDEGRRRLALARGEAA